MVNRDEDSESEDDEISKLLKNEFRYPLSRDGSLKGKPATYQSSWRIFSKIPPHANTVVRNSITKNI